MIFISDALTPDQNLILSSIQVKAFPMAGSTNQPSDNIRRRHRVHPQYSQQLNLQTFDESKMPDLRRRRHSLQNVYSQHPLSNIAKFQPNPLNAELIHTRDLEVLKEIIDYMKKLHEEAVFKRNYDQYKDSKESTSGDSQCRNYQMKRMSTDDGLKRWALLREQFRKQKQVCYSELSEVSSSNLFCFLIMIFRI